jgi:phospholipase C
VRGPETTLTRRRFLESAAAATATLALPGAGRAAASWARSAARLPTPRHSGIDHVVVLTMENRSFDHLLGWLPGANGRQAGLAYQDREGQLHATYALAPKFDGCGLRDPDHSHEGGLVQYDGGAADGFLRAASDLQAIGFYRREDLGFMGRIAPAWTVCDAYFAAVLGPSTPNRIFLSAGATDRLDNSEFISNLPTIWDRLAERGVAARYHTAAQFDDTILDHWGTKYERLVFPMERFFADCRSGRLPGVTYLDPEESGMDDHPPYDVRIGERFLATVYNAVVSSPAWPRTLLIVNFDEWGGFFDHVPPPPAPDPRPGYGFRGFRVPCLLISPFARRRYVAHALYDHASVLKLIQWRFGLAPLSERVTAATNLAAALDFTRRRLAAPRLTLPSAPTSLAC